MAVNFQEEKKIWKKKKRVVVGLDEAGRGPLAGPVVAAAVAVIREQFFINSNKKSKRFSEKDFLKKYNLFNVKDSKKLSEKKREEFYKILISLPEIEWGIGKVSERVIDRINILEATKKAMEKAVANLEKKLKAKSPLSHGRGKEVMVDFLIIDGNFKLDLDISQKSIIKADESVFSCVVAGIIAKVERDKMMRKYHKKYPEYGFGKHKGYGTKTHYQALKKYGPCPIHRRSFRPVSQLLE